MKVFALDLFFQNKRLQKELSKNTIKSELTFI